MKDLMLTTAQTVTGFIIMIGHRRFTVTDINLFFRRCERNAEKEN
jgi:hypothetical protein